MAKGSERKWFRRLRWLLGPLAALAALAATVLVLSAFGARTAPREPDQLGAFAAYRWIGDVHSVHAKWRVPEIKQGSACGAAATWIGAYEEGQGFIQIGTTETCVGQSPGLPLEAVYSAFWSDTTKHFLGTTLFDLHAGDVVDATLTLRAHLWRLTIADESSEKSASFTTSQETVRPPDNVQWAQEDVLEPQKYALYPTFGEITLSDVLVNGQVPSQEELESSGLYLEKETLVPSALRGDSFSIGGE